MDTGLDHERCYRAVTGRDARFDGMFYTAVRTTGIYCRPSCPATTPRRRNVVFYRTAAAAQREGFRACRRCRPDAVPGSAEWNVRGDVVARVMRLVADGAVERLGVAGVAQRLGYSQRHLNRLVTGELGAGVLAIARAQRAQTARILLETTAMPVSEVAWAAGFGSIRSFNDTMHAVYATTPSRVRAEGRRAGPRTSPSAPDRVSRPQERDPSRALPARPGPGGPTQGGAAAAAVPTSLTIRLATRAPFDPTPLLAFLGGRAIAGVEAWDGTVYRRALALPHGHATVAVHALDESAVAAELRLADLRDLAPAVARVRRMLDLDADPRAVGDVLGADPMLAGLLADRPGLRVPGCADAAEALVRAIVGQQISVAGARTVVGRLARGFGQPLAFPHDELDRVFPEPGALADADPGALSMPRSRGLTLTSACRALAEGRIVLDAGADRAESLAALERLRGIGPWTTAYVAMRGLGDPDVMLASDLGVRRALAACGQDDRPSAVELRAQAWRPWRSYVVAHLWAAPGGGAPADAPAAPGAASATRAAPGGARPSPHHRPDAGAPGTELT